MEDLDFVKAATKNPLIIIRFTKEPDLFLIFCADCDEKTKALSGLTLWGLRKSRGPHPYALKEDLVPFIFKPKLQKKADHQYTLEIQPLTQKITLIQKPNHFICTYPFVDDKKVGQITEVIVDYQVLPSMKMWFTIHATYKSGKDAPPLQLSTKIECSEDFTGNLFDFFKDRDELKGYDKNE